MSGESLHVTLPDDAATAALGKRLAVGLKPPGVVFLSGDLGAGKTTLVRALLRALGHQGPVPSPTYTLLEVYELAGLRYVHCDLYRVGDAAELEYLGLLDMADSDSLLLIEWPDHGAAGLFNPDLRIEIGYQGRGRSAVLLANSRRGREWLAAIS